MARFKTSGASDNALAQLLQLAQLSDQREAKRTQTYNSVYKEFGKAGDSFNNKEIQWNLDRMNKYYAENASKMSSEDIDMHNMTKEKLEYQQKQNEQFMVDDQRRFSFGNDMVGFADEYSEADNARSFSWKETLIEDGKMIERDRSVNLPSPEDYEGGEDNLEFQKAHNKALEDIGGQEGYLSKKEEYKRYLKNQISKQIAEYEDYQGKMIMDWGASGRLTSIHLNNFKELDESYGFILDSLEDDGLFDSEEKAAYQDAIMSKSSKPINDFIIKDLELKNSNRATLLNDMKLLKVQGDLYEKDMNAFLMSGMDMSEGELLQAAITIPKNTTHNPTDEDESYTYGDIRAVMSGEETASPELAGYLSSLETNLNQVKETLKNKDSAYMKNDGGSFLAGMEKSPWTEGLHDLQTGFVPKTYGEKKITTTAPVITKITDETSSPPKYSISLDTSSKTEQTIGKVLKPSEYDKSIRTSTIINKSTGEKIDMVSYDKENDIYTDSQGNKYPRDAIAVASIDDITPPIKIANGKFYFFNPMTNKVEEWAKNKSHKNQTIEQISIDGRIRNIPKNESNNLYWIDGEWTSMRSIRKKRRKS
tara:strand:- start:6962 stop:8737 length:1776 start_codon:yes stop_codon:yes gene_type:complete